MNFGSVWKKSVPSTVFEAKIKLVYLSLNVHKLSIHSDQSCPKSQLAKIEKVSSKFSICYKVKYFNLY